jgi:hypothetical protein
MLAAEIFISGIKCTMHMMKPIGRFIQVITLFISLSSKLKAQEDFLKKTNDTIWSIKYVFEARIDSVQTYPGDDLGNPIPYGRADWSCGAGNFQSMVYSRVYITVCRVYKGRLPEHFVLLIPIPYVNVHAMSNANGDTTLGYLYVPPSHGDHDSPLLPSKGYPIWKLYWAFDLIPVAIASNTYTIRKYAECPMRIPGHLLNNHGMYDQVTYYAWIGDKTILTREEFLKYLRNVRTLHLEALSRCGD